MEPRDDIKMKFNLILLNFQYLLKYSLCYPKPFWPHWNSSHWKICSQVDGSKITTNGDCSHEINRCLLLGRKVMTNLDSILKSRDITLPTKICLVKAMVFPVVMYGCESWTVKKAEHRRIDAFERWC